MTQHLKPLYLKIHIKGQPVNRVLIDNKIIVNILSVFMMKKLSKVNNDLVLINVFVYGFSRNDTRMRRVLPLDLGVGSRT